MPCIYSDNLNAFCINCDLVELCFSILSEDAENLYQMLVENLYQIFLLFLPWLHYNFYLVVIGQQQPYLNHMVNER